MLLLQTRDLLIKNKIQHFKDTFALYQMGDPEAARVLQGTDWSPIDLDNTEINKDTGDLIVKIDPDALQNFYSTPTSTFGFVEGMEALTPNITKEEKLKKKGRVFLGKEIEIEDTEQGKTKEDGIQFLKNLQKSSVNAEPVQGFTGIAELQYKKAKPFIERDLERTLTILEETKPTYFRYIDKDGKERQVVPRDINEFLIHLENKIEADLKAERGIDIEVDLTSEPLKDLQKRIIKFWKKFVGE